MRHIKKIISWYSRFEKPISSISLIVGFFVGSLTLTRVDKIFENILIGIQLAAVAICIVILHRQQAKHEISEKSDEGLARLHFWATTILQFLFGGILSTYLIFYFRGAVFGVAWPFLLVLVIALLASEALKKNYVRMGFQMGIFFLSLLTFSIFFVPVITHRIGPWIFVLSWAISCVVLFLFLFILWFANKTRLKKSRKIIAGVTIGISCVVGLLYFTNSIPPLPLLVLDSGIYHAVSRNSSGGYVVMQENQDINSSMSLFKKKEVVHVVPSSPIYAYSAIFSPISFNTKIIHEWQWYDTRANKWTTQEKIALGVSGGRINGYRTYSMITRLNSGQWRVTVRTQNGQVVGRIRFEVIVQNTVPTLYTAIK